MKKLLAIFLAVIMVVALLPMSAFAKTGSITTWKALQDAITGAGTTETTIQLTCDITALETDSSLTIGEGQKITIDLNGFVLNRGMFDSDGKGIPYYDDGGDCSILVKGELTIKDSNPTKVHKFNVYEGGSGSGRWYLNEASGTEEVAGGVITGSSYDAVHIDDGKLTLEGGNIVGNDGDNGTGVYAKHGTVVMNGGSICGNVSTDGGGVYIEDHSNFIMNNGEICNNNGASGGGLFVFCSTFTINNGKITKNGIYDCTAGRGVYIVDSEPKSSHFEMNGGEISGNFGDNGAGVSLTGPCTSFKMHGGKIVNNGSLEKDAVGGVYVVDGSFLMDGGLISGNKGNYAGGVFAGTCSSFILGGKAQVKGNTIDDESLSNVYLQGTEIELGNGTNGAVAPQDGFTVGVTTKKAPASGTPVVFSSNGSANDTKYFFSDSEDYYVGFDTKLQLVKPEANQYLVIIPSSDNGVVYTDKWVTVKSEKVTLSHFADDGYAFKNWEAVSGIKADAIADNSFTMPADKVKVTAKFEKATEKPEEKPVEKPEEKPEDKKSPKTGESNSVVVWFVLLCASFAGLVGCGKISKSKKALNK